MEVVLCRVVLPFRDIEDPVFVFVLLIQEPLDFIDRVSVHCLEATGRVCHADDVVSDVGQVEIVAIFRVSISLAPDQLTDFLKHFN